MQDAFKGKVAVVTGAASGIGLATCQSLLNVGATVVMVDRNEDALKSLTSKLGKDAVPQITDLLDQKDCEAMIPTILTKNERIDILYCNAGTYIGGDLIDTNAAAIDRMLNLNINAVIKNVRAVLPHMI